MPERRIGPTTVHGSCGAHRGAAVLLLGHPGAGKSDLLLRLIDRGFDLVADDRVVIESGQAAPAPSLAGLLEVRGLGLLRLPHVAPARLALIVLLDEPAARLPQPEYHRIGIPLLRMDPFTASAACRIGIALECLAGNRVLVDGAFDH